jgi:hypothetical protein
MRRSLLTALVVAVSLSVAAAELPLQRLIVVVRDRSGSFKPFAVDANTSIAKQLAAAGPGDTLVLIDIEEAFDPKRHAHERVLAAPPKSVFERQRTLREYRSQLAALKRAWSSADQEVSAFRNLVQRAGPVTAKRSDLFTALEYAATRLERHGGERFLLIYSDLDHDAAGIRTGLPPVSRMSFARVHVTSLFVPWRGSEAAKKKEQGWRDWFAASGASAFTLHDTVTSPNALALAPNSTPRTLQNPLSSWR